MITNNQQYRQPSFIIIGGQKCGTTSLYLYLTRHSNIIEAKTKEIHFFDINFSAGLNWYQSFFSQRADGQNFITGEATPYYLFHPLVPGRIYNTFPQVKLIVLLREPVKRAVSQYYHEVRLGYESLSFVEAINNEETRLAGEVVKMMENPDYHSFHHQHSSYLARGVYIEQLKRWWEFFPKKQILVLNSEEFFANPDETLKQVWQFLELPNQSSRFNLDIFDRMNKKSFFYVSWLKFLRDKMRYFNYKSYNSGQYEPISEDLYQQLKAYFSPYNEELFTVLGKRFDW